MLLSSCYEDKWGFFFGFFFFLNISDQLLTDVIKVANFKSFWIPMYLSIWPNILTGSRLTQLTIPGSREYVLIDKLEEGMSYVFSVKAVTSIGPGIETQKSITMGPQPGLLLR